MPRQDSIAVFCIVLLVTSILSSASATADTNLDKVRQYQKMVEEASQKAAEQDASAIQAKQESQQGQYSPQSKEPPTKPYSPSDEPEETEPIPSFSESTGAEPPPPYPRPSAPPSRLPGPKNTGAKQFCDPGLPLWACDGSLEKEDPDTTAQKILKWKQEREPEEESSPEESRELPSYITTEFRYDENGNLIEDERYDYLYNSFNQLASITDKHSGLLAEEYEYDENGNRIKKISYNDGTAKTTYYLDDYELTVDSEGRTIERTKIYHGQHLIAVKENRRTVYYHPDHLGSTDVITNSAGEVVEEFQYEPYGMPLSLGRSDYLYTGKEFDDTNLFYYGARYYNPLHARFTQPDTVIADVYNPQNLNRYSYVLNNPYKYVDPEGKEAFVFGSILLGIATALTLGALAVLGIAAIGGLSNAFDDTPDYGNEPLNQNLYDYRFNNPTINDVPNDYGTPTEPTNDYGTGYGTPGIEGGYGTPVFTDNKRKEEFNRLPRDSGLNNEDDLPRYFYKEPKHYRNLEEIMKEGAFLDKYGDLWGWHEIAKHWDVTNKYNDKEHIDVEPDGAIRHGRNRNIPEHFKKRLR